jgi:outer membrane lipoprotein-sorting protein
MKSIFFAFVFCCLSILSAAQPPAGMGKSDPEAKKQLDAVSAKFKTYKNVTAKFSLKMENAAGKSMGNKTGTVYMKGGKYRISIPGQDIFSDGSNVWTYDKAANEVTINKIDPSANTITPQKLFTNFYDKDFLYRLNGDVTVAGKKLKEIELTPVDKSKTFHKVLLYLDKSSINTTKIFEKTGNRYTYSISNMNTAAPIDDKMFLFDASKYPGVEVVDLR